MKIAIVYNRESQAVINLFGTPNLEKYEMVTIRKIQRALTKGGHQVKAFEGDKNIISNLEKFMPAVVAGERPGLVFNLSYGIQGKGRYIHMPGILEMLGIPYFGSGPESHALALDKVLTKMILLQKGLPTPRFTVLDTPDSPFSENLRYPLIVKPKSEAVSFGLRIVRNEAELRDGVANIFETFNSPTLVEEYIDGREINVGLLGNGDNLVAMPPLEIVFEEGEPIYTFEDKKKTSGRKLHVQCPAALTPEEEERAKSLAIATFNALNLYDCARVDFRMDREGNFYILEVNSMASLGAGGSYVHAAAKMGMDYDALMNRLVDVASERYFGPYHISHINEEDHRQAISLFHQITNGRDRIENELKNWTDIPSWTNDPVGLKTVRKKLTERLQKLGLSEASEFTNHRSAWTYETASGLAGGTLLVVPIDIPGRREGYPVAFRREEEWLYGEGIASSRSGIVTILSVLQALKEVRCLASQKIGVFFYADEGQGMRYSHPLLKAAARQAREVLVLQPGLKDGKVIEQRRGSARYSVIVEGNPQRIGNKDNQPDVMSFFLERGAQVQSLSAPDRKMNLAVQDLHSERYRLLLPHRLQATIYMTWLEKEDAENAEGRLFSLLRTRGRGLQSTVDKVEERPPLKRRKNHPLLKELGELAREWNIPFGVDSSLLPSAAGEIDPGIPTLCGLAPWGRDVYTPSEAIHRRELIEKILLLSLYLAKK